MARDNLGPWGACGRVICWPGYGVDIPARGFWGQERKKKTVVTHEMIVKRMESFRTPGIFSFSFLTMEAPSWNKQIGVMTTNFITVFELVWHGWLLSSLISDLTSSLTVSPVGRRQLLVQLQCRQWKLLQTLFCWTETERISARMWKRLNIGWYSL